MRWGKGRWNGVGGDRKKGEEDKSREHCAFCELFEWLGEEVCCLTLVYGEEVRWCHERLYTRETQRSCICEATYFNYLSRKFIKSLHIVKCDHRE